MGIVLRQSFKYSLISLLGSLIGALSVLFVYPLRIEAYGFSQTFSNFALFLLPVMGFSSNSLIIKYYHKKTGPSNSILFNGILISFFYSFIFCLIFFQLIFPNLSFLQKIGFNSDFIKTNNILLLVSGFILVLTSLLVNHCNNLQRAVVPNLLNNVGLKIFIPLLIICTYFDFISIESIPIAITVFYSLSLVGLTLYTHKLSGLSGNYNFIDFKGFFNKNVLKYSFITGLTGLAGILATKIDIISIAGLKSYSDVGKYSLPYFMAGLIEIPMAGITSISSPLIAKHLKEKEYKDLDILLKKASDSLFLIGTIIFCLIFASFNDLIALSNNPEVFDNGILIFSIIGIAKLVDMVTSLNTQTISYSKIYGFNLVFVIISAIFNVTITYFLTRIFGIIGTSIAILSTITLFNLLKFIVLKFNLNINPFSISSIKILIIFVFELILIYFLRISFHPFVNIGIKSAMVILSYLVWIKYLKPSEDIYQLLFGSSGILKNISNLKKLFGF